MLKILIFSGSARQGNYTSHVAKFVHEIASSYEEIEAEIVDPISLGLKFADEGDPTNYPELTQKVIAADGYIIISPEYNHAFSGSVKFMLDLHLKEYVHKPVALTGVSKGAWGGTRAIEALVHTVRELGMVVTFTDLNITNVRTEFENGEVKNREDWERRARKMIDELVWMGNTLKAGREK